MRHAASTPDVDRTAARCEGVENTFAVRLAKARQTRGLTQVALAQKAKLPASSISHFESKSRRPSLDNLCRLATALGVSTDLLLGRERDSNNSTPNVIAKKLDALSDCQLEVVDHLVDVLIATNGGSSAHLLHVHRRQGR